MFNDPIADAHTRRVYQWIEKNLPSFEEIERVTQQSLDMHTAYDNWDGMYSFILHSWNGKRLSPELILAISPEISPDDYSYILRNNVAVFMAKRLTESDKPPIVACTLQIEGFALQLERPPTSDERKLIDQRKLHTIPGAVERCFVASVDIAHRKWITSKDRYSDVVTSHGPEENGVINGRIMEAMKVCMATIAVVYAAREQSV